MFHRIALLIILLSAAAPVVALDSAWVVTTDYSTFGRLRSFAAATPWAASGDLATIPGDAVARHYDGLIYVVGRAGHNLVQVYQPDGALVREFGLGAGRNPQDIAFDGNGEAYVSCYDAAELLRVDVETGLITGTYSTAAWADPDGLPETAWMAAIGDLLYITCQKLDRDNWYLPAGPGQLLVFDMAAETFGPAIDLFGGDPYTRLEQVAGPAGEVRLRVGCAGSFGVADGGIETIDPATGRSLGYDITEAALGGDVTAFVTTAPGVVHALVSDASFVTSLRRADLASDQVTVLATGSGYDYADVAWDGGFQLYLADRAPTAPGIRVYDTDSGAELTTGPVGTGLPPFLLVLPGVDVAAAAPLPGRLGTLVMGAPFPNPCNPRAEVVVSGRPAAAVQVSVCDVRGRRLTESAVRLDGDGRAVWTFTGRDRHDRALPAGVYRVVARTDTDFTARSVTLVK